MKIIIGNKQGYKINGSMKFFKYVSTGPDYTEPFYVENTTNSTQTVSIKKSNSNPPTISVEYSTDRNTWNTLGSTSTTALTFTLPAGSKIYLRASTSRWGTYWTNYTNITGMSKVGGNVMSLLYGANFTGKEVTFPSNSNYAFEQLFYQNTVLTDAGSLLLPATTLVQGCYGDMFNSCTNLAKAPALPALTVVEQCYSGMFYSTSLVVAPELPATNVEARYYQFMFQNCSKLTTVPLISAKSVGDEGARSMFSGCSKLNYIKCLTESNLTSNGLNDWVNRVAASGTFVKKAGVTWPTGANGIPNGWTVVEE